MDPIIKELRDAAEDMLRFGEHDGMCDNVDEDYFQFPDEPCQIHLATFETRRARLTLAIAAFDIATNGE